MSEPTLRVEEILKQVGLLSEVNEQLDLLTKIVKVVNSQGNMDKDTVIYRLAMTIYHAKKLTNKSLLPVLEDPGAIYLSALDNPRLKALITEMTERYRGVTGVELVKTFMCFLIAAYVVGMSSP